jgi:PAS domain S-box-containing protein
MTRSKQEQITRVVLDSIADGVFAVDHNWRITLFNPAAERITGIDREEAVGRYCWDVFRANVCDTGCALRRTVETGQPVVNDDVQIMGPQGRRIPVSISTAALKDAKGKVIGGGETFRDLSLVEQLRRQIEGRYTFADIVGRSEAMQRLFEILPSMAETDSTVLIQGASGTGKELVARAIHNLSARRKGPFVAVNCGAVPDTLLASELFGYKAGAFTGARKDKPGRFALAQKGSIFLDEISDISPAMQAAMLRVLQERVFEPLGGTRPTRADVRVVAATNQDLADMVQAGRFREDLYYRLNVVRVELPSLRDRREDIPLLVEHLIVKLNRLKGKEIIGASEEVLAKLMDHAFPGNVRELENILEYAFMLCHGGRIEPQHLPPAWRDADPGVSSLPAGMTCHAMERVLLQDALRRHSGNRRQAARELGIHPSTLYRKVRALGIESLA